MSAWSVPPGWELPPVQRAPQSQRYGHCYDTEAGDRLRQRRALAGLRAAVRAAQQVEIEYRGRGGRKERHR